MKSGVVRSVFTAAIIMGITLSNASVTAANPSSPRDADEWSNVYRQAANALQSGDFEQALDYLEPWAERGQPTAQAWVGEIYLFGAGNIEKNAELGVDWLQTSANQGNPQAQNTLAMSYMSGNGVEKDESRAVDLFQQSAGQEYARAQLHLAMAHINGRGDLEEDIAEGVALLEAAAENGESKALFFMGRLRMSGNYGVEQDVAEGARLLYESAAKGRREAQDELISFAQEGRADAQCRLAALLRRQGTAEERILEWYRRAASQGHPCGFSGYRSMANRGNESAAEALRNAAEDGQVNAEYQLGRLLQNQQASEERILSWYRNATVQGHAGAAEAIRDMVSEGSQMAYETLWELADNGVAHGQYQLALFGLEPNAILAYDDMEQWFRGAFEQGIDAAGYELAQLLKDHRRDSGRALDWYVRAAERGVTRAGEMACALYSEDFSERYPERADFAMEWCQRASDFSAVAAFNVAAERHQRHEYEGAARAYRKAVNWEPSDDNADLSANRGAQKNATWRLARLYVYGWGVPQSDEMALELLEPLTEGEARGWKEEIRRVNRLEEEMERGEIGPEGMAVLALRYRNGNGVEPDDEKARDLLRRSAEAGDPFGQHMLAQALMAGEIVARDRERAMELLHASASQGYVEAQYCLGMAYENGEGVPRDMDAAEHWKEKAAEQGYDGPSLFGEAISCE